MLTQATFHAQLSYLITNPEQVQYLLAVSGGVDSMVLLNLFMSSNLKFEVAHVNYKLRGKDSEEDQKIVEEFCAQHDLKLHVYEVSDKDSNPENSVQLWARNLRYEFFSKIKIQSNLEFTVTAHHLNDQVETFIINLSRGSGLKGLSGIPANENRILRPLLLFSKDDIYAFAKTNKIEFREDSSNLKNDYLRNFIRNEITPKLLETNGDFLSNFSKSLGYLAQTKDFADEQILKIEDELLEKKDGLITLNRKKIVAQSKLLKFGVLRKFGFESETEIEKICTAEKGKHFKSSTHILTADREVLIITPINQAQAVDSSEIIIAENLSQTSATLPLNKFITDESCYFTNLRWDFVAEKIQFPLKIRHKLKGDVFFPVGMSGSKKISKFFKDEKLPIFAQHEIWLLCDANNAVLGIIPFRQDRRFAADINTQNIISITF